MTRVHDFSCSTHRHAAREAEPKDYDVSTATTGNRDLLKATYSRIGSVDEVYWPIPSFTTACFLMHGLSDKGYSV